MAELIEVLKILAVGALVSVAILLMLTGVMFRRMDCLFGGLAVYLLFLVWILHVWR